MKSIGMALLLLAGVAGLSQAAASVANPMEKVVSLLKDLETSLKNDEKAEQAVYDKYACWCEVTTARKAKAIEDAKDELKSFGHGILKLKGTVAVRTDESSELESNIKENKDSQEEATVARSKENAAWQSEAEETKQALSAINTAMMVLVKATKPALLQQNVAGKLQASLAVVVSALPTKMLASVNPAKLEKLRLLATSRSQAGYSPQSATIQGILSDMYTTMSSDLMSSTGAEARQNRLFEDLMATKDKELTTLKNVLTRKQGERAEAASMLAETEEAYDETSKQLKADVEFFDVTKDACQEKSNDWGTRSSLRQQELDGIQQALTILSSDEARKLFAKSIKPGMEPSLLEVDVSVAPNQKKQQLARKNLQVNLDKLYAKLKAKASSSHSLKLASLAAQVKIAKAGHFDQVVKSIDDLIAVLQREQESDTNKRDGCKEQYQDIAQDSSKLDWKIKVNQAQIDKLESLIEAREEDKKQTIAEIVDTQGQIKDLKAERTTENEAFVQAKKDDQAAIALIKQARDTMTEFYAKNGVKMGPIQGSAKLLQLTANPMEDADKAPDASFSGKGSRKNQSKGIVSILTMLMEDLEAEVANGVKAEAAAQVSFEKALSAAQNLLEELGAKKISLDQAIADRQTDKTEEKNDKRANDGDLADQIKEKQSIKKDCDFMLEKYEERRKHRDAETEALRDAKEFLSNYYDSAEA